MAGVDRVLAQSEWLEPRRSGWSPGGFGDLSRAYLLCRFRVLEDDLLCGLRDSVGRHAGRLPAKGACVEGEVDSLALKP